MNWQHLFFRFDGRINRAPFWAGGVIVWIVSSVNGAVNRWPNTLDTVTLGSALVQLVTFLFTFVLLWAWLALVIKRWHDRDKSGWWTLIVLIPIIGWIWMLVELGFLRGTEGSNQYGADPLGA